MVFYAFAVVWPPMVSVLYANGRTEWGSWVACIVGIAITAGTIAGGFFNKHMHWIIRFVFTVGSILIAGEYSISGVIVYLRV